MNTSGFSYAGGFNTITGIDLSGFDGFAVEYVISNNYDGIVEALANGAFFGVVNSPTANAIDATALYNNAGNGDPFGTSIGLTVGIHRGVVGPDLVLDEADGNNGTFTQLFDPEVEVLDDATEGYTISVGYSEHVASGNTAVTITSTGLATDFNFSGVGATNFASLAVNVTPNVSAQFSNLNVVSITIMEGAETNVLLGDINQDEAINFVDIGPFINILGSSGFSLEADINQDGVVNFLDIGPFVAILSGS